MDAQPEPARPVFVVIGRQRPHEVMFLAWSALIGAGYLLGAPPPGSIDALMPGWVQTLWDAALLAGGVTGLAGCWWRGHIGRGLRLELSAMLTCSGSALLYTVAVFVVGGFRGLGAGGILAAWAVACWVRARQIHRDLHRLAAVSGGGS